MAAVPLHTMTQMSQVPQMPQNYQVPMSQMPQVPVNQSPVVVQAALGSEPCRVTCPSCGASIVTSVSSQPSTQTHLTALLLCFLCVCLACIPYCTDSCQNADHHCPKCDAFLGTYRR